MALLATSLAPKLVSVTAIVSDAPALGAPLARVLRIRRVCVRVRVRVHGYSLVFTESLELAERPLRVPVSRRVAITDAVQLLKDDAVAVVFECFLYDSVCDRVKLPNVFEMNHDELC